jgi:hypothetical protein
MANNEMALKSSMIRLSITSGCVQPLMNTNRLARALAAGALGACALTLIHQLLRRAVPHAPRIDVLGMRGIARLSRAMGARAPDRLHTAALLADIASNAAYYSLVGAAPGHGAATGAALGLAAGAGAVLLPGPLGLGTAPTNRTGPTQLLTVALYSVGGVVAGATFDAMTRRD